MKWQLVKGDGVMLLFSGLDPSCWSKRGVKDAPKDMTRHSISHPVAYAGWPQSSDIGDTVGGSEMVIEGPEIHLGYDAQELIARADRVEAELDKIKTAFSEHQHSFSYASGTAGTVVASTASSSAYVPGDVGCDKVKGI